MTKPATAVNALLEVDVQNALTDSLAQESEEPPSPAQLVSWANAAYAHVATAPSEMTIRLVDTAEITALNHDYRQKDKATNVLSFPVELDPILRSELDINLLGDVIICHAVIVSEAQQQAKSIHHHYAHMVTHGVLHLCGYDHQDDIMANEMESLETVILAQQGIANPYQ